MRDGVKEITLNSERIKYWLTCGAQPSDRVAWLLAKCEIIPPTPKRFSSNYILPKEVQQKK